jgi:adenosylcobalamin-dependent ribonucleoside-diphosphate reductase
VYDPVALALEIFRSRHAAHDKETWGEASERVALQVSAAETGEARDHWREKFAWALKYNLFMPGGRIWYGSGRPRPSLLNCVAGETMVHTRNGLMPARALVNSTVETLSQDGVYRPARWASYGTQELCLVEFENGDTLLATPGHQWVVTKNKGGEERITTVDLEGRMVPMQHLAPAQRTLLPDAYRTGIQHGLVFGDGTVNHTGKAHLLQFGDSRHLVEDYFDEHTVQYHKRYPEGVTYVGALPANWKTRMPSVQTHGASYVFGFIAGYIASDGNVDERGSLSLHSSKREDLVEIRKLAAGVGLPTTSITLARELSPFDGQPAPLYCLRFAKTGIDSRLILKNKHREYLANAPVTTKRTTMKVVRVTATGRNEEVFCCEEPETHTWVAGMGYLTGNCYVIPTEDSREGWGKTVSDTIVISGTGGGVGCNFSPSRPRGQKIRGTGGESTGSVSEMEMVNGVGNTIKAGGGRRVALMFCLALSHGDIVEFLDKKLDKNVLNNANVSIVFDEDPDEFFELVKADAEWPLIHQGRQIGAIPARALWERIVKNALEGGEPGMLNGYLANKMSNIWYVEKLTSTNPCGEIWMSPYDCCCLGALVLPRFVVGGEVDWTQLKDVVRLGVRFLDNVLSVNTYPLPEIQAKCSQLRRIGLGVTGLHHMLLELGLKYNSPEGLEFVDKLMSRIKNWSYEASSDLAVEKGSFPAYDAEKFLKSGFAKTLKPSIRSKLRRDGMRNCATMTIAPVGTGSVICNTTSGIEPMYAPAFKRTFRKGDELASEELVDPMFQDFVNQGRDVSHFVGAMDLSIRDHMEMQRTCQRHVDNAVSKTINLRADTSAEELSDLYMEFIGDLKGVTVYPDGSRADQPLTALSLERAIELAKSNAGSAVGGQDACRSGNCDV